jgi:formylglycine-generating enzyme required for sulfatase activity
MEFVFIPAGKFIMGTPEPESPWIGGSIMAVGIILIAVMVGYVVVRSIRRRKFQYSLRWLIGFVFIVGIGQYGGFRWWEAREAGRNWLPWESPEHEVTIGKPFYMGKFEVTQEQYQQVMGANPSRFKGAKLPVERVSWGDAKEFCKRASAQCGLTLRLPSEAEWEYACRAGTRTNYHSGDTAADLARAAWYDKNSGGTTHPVGQKEANVFGLHDMHGNVWEWCEDDWHENYQSGPKDGQAWINTPRGGSRVLRGGDWYFNPGVCRSAFRIRSLPDYRDCSGGFRVVRSGQK